MASLRSPRPQGDSRSGSGNRDKNASPTGRAGKKQSSVSDQELTLQPPIIVPMTQEQFERAASILAELMLWAWKQKRDEREAA
jgi:hypothetical protein